MPRKLLVVAVAGALVPALVLGSGAAAASRPTGWAWAAATNHGGTVRFKTNLGETSIRVGFTATVVGVQCGYNGQVSGDNTFPLQTTKATPVRGGRISATQTASSSGPVPTVFIKMTGRLSGKRATVRVTWSLPSNTGAVSCSPTSGSFTFGAHRQHEVFG